MRRVSGLILIILNSYSLPGSRGPALFSGPVEVRCIGEGPSSRRLRSSISVLWQSASIFSPSSTNAPNVAISDLPLSFNSETALERLVAFLSAGFRAPVPTHRIQESHVAVQVQER